MPSASINSNVRNPPLTSLFRGAKYIVDNVEQPPLGYALKTWTGTVTCLNFTSNYTTTPLKSTDLTITKTLKFGKFNLVSMNVKKSVYGYLKIKNQEVVAEEKIQVPQWEFDTSGVTFNLRGGGEEIFWSVGGAAS